MLGEADLCQPFAPRRMAPTEAFPGDVKLQRQLTLRTSTGSPTPLRVTWRGSDSPKGIELIAKLKAAPDTEDLLTRRGGANAGGHVHAAYQVVAALARRLRCVETDADRGREPVLVAMPRQSPLDVDPALEPIDRPPEGHEEPVAGVVDLLTAVGWRRRIAALGHATRSNSPQASSPIEPDQVGRRDDVREHE